MDETQRSGGGHGGVPVHCVPSTVALHCPSGPGRRQSPAIPPPRPHRGVPTSR
jgi:hypothetical protein